MTTPRRTAALLAAWRREDDEMVERITAERDALAAQLAGWTETAAWHAGNEQFYRGLLVETATHLGPQVFVSDDGSIQADPIVLKVPKMVEALAAQLTREGER